MIETRVYAGDILEHPECIAFMYAIITVNMHRISPNKIDGSKESYEMWYNNCIVGNVNKSHYRTAIAYDNGIPCGFFQFEYDNKNNVAIWTEMEIDDLHKGDHKTFHALIGVYLDEDTFAGYDSICGYINKTNAKSQTVVISIGFEMTEETERGAKYICTRKKIVQWYKSHPMF